MNKNQLGYLIQSLHFHFLSNITKADSFWIFGVNTCLLGPYKLVICYITKRIKLKAYLLNKVFLTLSVIVVVMY